MGISFNYILAERNELKLIKKNEVDLFFELARILLGGCNSVGRVIAFQAICRRFEPDHPLSGLIMFEYNWLIYSNNVLIGTIRSCSSWQALFIANELYGSNIILERCGMV